MIIWFAIIVVVAFLTWSLPLPGKLIALLVNYFIPDGLPFLDEVIQFVGIIKHFSRK